jgi:hypothetical protein
MCDVPLCSSHIAARFDRTSSCADGIVNKTPSPGLIHEAHVACWLAVGNVYGHVDWVALRQEIVLNHLSASSPVLSVVYDCTYLYPTPPGAPHVGDRMICDGTICTLYN